MQNSEIEILAKSKYYYKIQIAELEILKEEIKTEENKKHIDEMIKEWQYIGDNYYFLKKENGNCCNQTI